MKGLHKAYTINKVFTFANGSICIYETENSMHIEAEDFTVEDALGVVLVRGVRIPSRRITQVIAPAGEDQAKIGVVYLESKPHFINSRRISGSAARLLRSSSPVTEIGVEALRTFAFDIENVNEAFDKAMKKHVRTVA